MSTQELGRSSSLGPAGSKEIFSLGHDVVQTAANKINRGADNREITQLLNSFSMMKRLTVSQTRRSYRHPKQLEDDILRTERAMVKLMKTMDFQFIRRFSDSQIEKLVHNIQVITKKPDEFVYHKGDIASHVFFVFLGEVDVLGPEPGDPVKRLGPCLNFGDAERFGSQRKSSVVAHSYTVLGAIDRPGFFVSRENQRVMEDSRIVSTLKSVCPFSALTDRELKPLIPRVVQIRAPARLPLCGSSAELAKNVMIVMSGVYEVRATVLVTRQSIGLNVAGQTMGFSDVPIMAVGRGSMWNADLVFGSEEQRDWCTGVEFSHYNVYPREDGKCIIISLRELLRYCWMNKHLKRWIDMYASLFRNTRRQHVYRVLTYLTRPDFQSKISGYMKEIIKTLDEGELFFLETVKKFEKEILEESEMRHDLADGDSKG